MIRTEKFNLSGSDLIQKLKRLIKEGNIRRITVKNSRGDVMAEFPLTVGLVGTLAAPTLAAIGTLVALAADCSITVEKQVNDPEDEPDDESDYDETETDEEE